MTYTPTSRSLSVSLSLTHTVSLCTLKAYTRSLSHTSHICFFLSTLFNGREIGPWLKNEKEPCGEVLRMKSSKKKFSILLGLFRIKVCETELSRFYGNCFSYKDFLTMVRAEIFNNGKIFCFQLFFQSIFEPK